MLQGWVGDAGEEVEWGEAAPILARCSLTHVLRT